MGLEWEVQVRFPSDTPVAGVELNPWVRVNYKGSYLSPPNYTVQFTWDRELSTSSKYVQNYVALQDHAARTSSMTSSGDEFKQENCGLLNSRHSKIVEGEGKTWIQVGSSRTYIPSQDDIDCSLRLVSVAIDDMGIKMSPVNVFVTSPVIRLPRPYPRHMVVFCSLRKFRNPKFAAKPFKDESFRVLSYNILADLYTIRDAYSQCPKWALTWEYRRRNLLNEMLSYDADILCLQEVQSDHFNNFFEPEFAKMGYSAIYKRKTKEVYSANQYVIDGCATFFRHDRFKVVVKYEVEYDKMALPVIEILEPDRRNDAIFRLMKDNVALVVILEEKDNGHSRDAVRSRICVANTHIHCGSDASDVRLFQVVNLIRGLEKIDSSGIPILVCGDMNSLPGSDPHRFLVNGEVGCFSEKYRDPLGVHRHLKLSHSMHLGYIVLNRPWAFVQWLEKAIIEEEYILMAEPDHIFANPLPNLVHGDHPAAFPFFYIKPADNEKIVRKYYPKEKGPVTNVDPIGNSPVIIKKALLEKIAPTWMNVSLRMKDDPETDKAFGWVLEMYGYAVASALHDVRHILRKDFMLQPPWDLEVGKKFIIHYTYGCDYNMKDNIQAMPHDAHPMGVLVSASYECSLSSILMPILLLERLKYGSS